MAGPWFLLNDRELPISRSAGSLLLDFLRDDLGLTGTKDGCREGDCGACVVLVGSLSPGGIVYRTVNSCLLPLGDVAGCHVVTIEGLNQAELSPIQQALVDEGAIQCGFCTPGLVVALTGFFLGKAPLSEAEGVAALGGNICRCTGYLAIRRAIARLCGRFAGFEALAAKDPSARVAALVEHGLVPRYFLEVPSRLRLLGEPSKTGASDEGRRSASPPVLVGGGTDLFVTQAERLHDAELTFLSRDENLRGIRVEGIECRVGAATPLAEIETSPVIRQMFPDLGRAFARIASLPIRNRATVAGNIVNASPAGDVSVILLALNAAVVLARKDRQRKVSLRDFFRGYKVLDMAADEMIAEIRFEVAGASARFNFEKVGRRPYLDIAAASSAIKLRVADGRIVEARVAAGSVAPVPLYLRDTSEFLKGRPVSSATALGAASVAGGEISPISDVRGSAEYKRALLSRLILAHFLTLFPDRVPEEDFA